MINVIVVDDHPLMRLGIKSSLQKFVDEIKVVGEASTADELFKVLQDLDVDVILLDIQMPGMSCEEAVKKLKSERSDIKVIIVSSNYEEETIFRLVEFGIDGFVPKMAKVEDIRNAILEVFLGRLTTFFINISHPPYPPLPHLHESPLSNHLPHSHSPFSPNS